MNKEEIYDAEVSPLMAQILEICKRAGIGMIADFAIPTDDDPDLRVMSMLPDETGKNTKEHRGAAAIIRPAHREPLHMTVTNADGSKTMIAVIS